METKSAGAANSRPPEVKDSGKKKKKEHGNGFAVKVLYPFFYWLLWLVLRFYHWPTFRGRENLPKGSCILCANHAGFADPIWIFLAMQTRYPPWAMAKKKLFDKPILRTILYAFRAFPVNRQAVDMAAVKKSLTVLKRGEKLLIFPEGTRIRHGKVSQPKSGAMLLANRADVPIVPVYITTNRKPFQPIKVIIGEPYVPAYSCRRPENDELDKLTAEMMEKIYAMGKKK